MTSVFTIRLFLVLALAASTALRAEWRKVGNAAMDLRLNGVATGPMDRAAWSADGRTLFVRTSAGQWFRTPDGEGWAMSDAAPTAVAPGIAERLPEPTAALTRTDRAGLVYAAGQHAWRSEDGGRSWRNLTQWKQGSLLGGPALSLAVRPGDAEDITVAGATGVWRSLDGGLTWSSLNGSLPHLPVRRILSLPRESTGLRVALLAPANLTPAALEWSPGERTAWQTIPGLLSTEQSAKTALSRQFGVVVTALASSGELVYAGAADGRIWTSLDRGTTWQEPRTNPGAVVEAFAFDPREPLRAIASLRRTTPGPVILRTPNGGLFWDDISSNLPEIAVFGLAADYASGALYAATAGGLYQTTTDLTALGPPTAWRKIETGLPAAPVFDVKLDPVGQNLFIALYGFGVFTETAPHRRKEWKIVTSADWMARPAAPGALVSILGGKVTSVRAGDKSAAILHSGERETQIQLPFDLTGATVTLLFDADGQSVQSSLPLLPTAPAILVDRDGTPMVLDAATGAMLDGQNPGRAGTTIQVLASGLGRVTPYWSTGSAAPAGLSPESLPAVSAPVRAWLDNAPLEVVRATLAPGYIGYYLVEVRLPDFINHGPADFFLEAGNSLTNRVRLYVEP